MTTRLATATVASLGVVLAGCGDCRLPLGLATHPAIGAALKRHLRDCAAFCPRCYGEGELASHGDGRLCVDCKGWAVVEG